VLVRGTTRKTWRLSLQTIWATRTMPLKSVDSGEAGLQLPWPAENFFSSSRRAAPDTTSLSGYRRLTPRNDSTVASGRHNGVPDCQSHDHPPTRTPETGRSRSFKAGADRYLAKPFAPEEMLHAVAASCASGYRLLKDASELFPLPLACAPSRIAAARCCLITSSYSTLTLQLFTPRGKHQYTKHIDTLSLGQCPT